MLIEAIGMAGGLALSLCGLPAAFSAIKDGKAEINSGMLWLWFAGEILMLIYVAQISPTVPLIMNYMANIVLLSVLVYYKYFPRSKNERN